MRLTEAQLAAALAQLPTWEQQGDTITRTIRFPEFMDGIRFLNRIAELAEAADHHPDIDIRYRTIRFALTTHSEGGLTHKDVDLAAQIDRALDAAPGAV